MSQFQINVRPMSTTTHDRIDIQRDARELYRAQLGLDRAVSESALDPGLADLVRLRASQINGCAYCVDQHTRDALAAGESERRLFAVSAWRESPLFSERERAAFALTEAVTLIAERGSPDEEYEAAAEHFAPAELAALLYAIVLINGWNRLAVSTHMVFEP
jgi:AhpD family alkylhydroperoxidase